MAKYPKREEPDSEAPVAILGCRFQVHSEDLSADKYLPLLDSVPEYMSLTFISAKEGIRLGYGSEIGAENATAALQDVTKKHVATGLTLQCARVQGPSARTEKSGNALGALGTSVTSSSSSSPVTPWKKDLEALDTKLSGEIISLRTKQEDLSCMVTKVQDVQTQDTSVLRLVSIRMGVTLPDPNNPIEVTMAAAGAIPGVSSSSPSPPLSVPSPSTHDTMEGVIGSGLKRKTRTEETSLRTRWLLLEPGSVPIHSAEWGHHRVHLLSQSGDNVWLMTLVNGDDQPVGEPFSIRNPVVATTAEEADSLLAQKLGLQRTYAI